MNDQNEYAEDGKFKVEIDGKKFSVDEGSLDGREVLELAGRHPVDQFIAYWLGKDSVLEDLGLERKVHFKKDSSAYFFTFDADRSFRFEIEGKREDWGAPKVNEATLRHLAGVDTDFRVFLIVRDGAERLIARNEMVDLSGEGIERFRVERILKIRVDNEDDGKSYWLEGLPETHIKTLIEKMYTEIGIEHGAKDRLRCEKGQEDVFQFGGLTLKEYLNQGHCSCLEWIFAGDTGGAVCLF